MAGKRKYCGVKVNQLAEMKRQLKGRYGKVYWRVLNSKRNHLIEKLASTDLIAIECIWLNRRGLISKLLDTIYNYTTFFSTRLRTLSPILSVPCPLKCSIFHLGSQKVYRWDVELPLAGNIFGLLWDAGFRLFCLLSCLTKLNFFFSQKKSFL